MEFFARIVGPLKEGPKDNALSSQEQGLKFGWTLKVYCDDTEREDGFMAKAYIYQDKIRLDAIPSNRG